MHFIKFMSCKTRNAQKKFYYKSHIILCKNLCFRHIYNTIKHKIVFMTKIFEKNSNQCQGILRIILHEFKKINLYDFVFQTSSAKKYFLLWLSFKMN